MQLRRHEAKYLMDRIRFAQPRSLLAGLAGDSAAPDAPSVWLLPGLASYSAEIRSVIEAARRFALVVHGANLLYYRDVARWADQADRVEEADGLLHDWAVQVWPELGTLHPRHDLWQCAALRHVVIGERTRRFVEHWTESLQSLAGPTAVRTDGGLQELIRQRERETKGELRARLWNAQRRDAWAPSGPPVMLAFRWTVARGLLRDIAEGLSESSAAGQGPVHA
jgi:hypothetical protein